MERPKKSRLKDKDMDSRLEQIYRNALGIPIILDSAPSKPSDMKSNSIGKNGTDIYIRTADGVLLKVQATEITED